jgi:hypothetical protein
MAIQAWSSQFSEQFYDLAGGVVMGTTNSECFWDGDLAKSNPRPRFQVYVFKRK